MANNKKNISNSSKSEFPEQNSELILKSEPNEIPEYPINTMIKKENPTQVVGCSIEFVGIQAIKSEDIGLDHVKVN